MFDSYQKRAIVRKDYDWSSELYKGAHLALEELAE